MDQGKGLVPEEWTAADIDAEIERRVRQHQDDGAALAVDTFLANAAGGGVTIAELRRAADAAQVRQHVEIGAQYPRLNEGSAFLRLVRTHAAHAFAERFDHLLTASAPGGSA